MRVEFDTKNYLNDLRKNKDDYFKTFINTTSLATGILVLQPGEEDTQTPHDSDEVYYILKGNGYLKIKNKDYKISEGKVFFVKKDLKHYFFGNTKELTVLYFFGGPDS